MKNLSSHHFSTIACTKKTFIWRFKAVQFRWLPISFAIAAAPLASAQEPASELAPASHDCMVIDDNVARLACYDRAFGQRAQLPSRLISLPALPVLSTTVSPVVSPVIVPVTPPAGDTVALNRNAATADLTQESSPLSAVWELRNQDKRGTFKLVPHKTNYLLPVHYSTRINQAPSSPAPGHTVESALPLDAAEAKFQLSFKIKAWENVFGDNGDVWLAYTQQSSWQVFNRDISSPFRETTYEPELIFSLRTNADLLGWHWRLLNLGLVHQSNGRPLPQSRSWNRLYAQFGLERGPLTVLIRPWYRLPENAASDDNPDIHTYLGSGDLQVAYVNSGHVFSVLGRYSRTGKRGGVQGEWAFPISKSLKGYVQLTRGYGASLIDYNHSQTTAGVGFVFLPWK